MCADAYINCPTLGFNLQGKLKFMCRICIYTYMVLVSDMHGLSQLVYSTQKEMSIEGLLLLIPFAML